MGLGEEAGALTGSGGGVGVGGLDTFTPSYVKVRKRTSHEYTSPTIFHLPLRGLVIRLGQLHIEYQR